LFTCYNRESVKFSARSFARKKVGSHQYLTAVTLILNLRHSTAVGLQKKKKKKKKKKKNLFSKAEMMITKLVMGEDIRVFCYSTAYAVRAWLQLRFDFDLTSIRRAFDCISKVIKVTVT